MAFNVCKKSFATSKTMASPLELMQFPTISGG